MRQIAFNLHSHESLPINCPFPGAKMDDQSIVQECSIVQQNIIVAVLNSPSNVRGHGRMRGILINLPSFILIVIRRVTSFCFQPAYYMLSVPFSFWNMRSLSHEHAVTSRLMGKSSKNACNDMSNKIRDRTIRLWLLIFFFFFFFWSFHFISNIMN